MAQATHTQRATGASAWQWLGDIRTAIADRMTQRRLYRTTRDELMALSDRELADLGLFRADIRDVARAAARGA